MVIKVQVTKITFAVVETFLDPAADLLIVILECKFDCEIIALAKSVQKINFS